MNSNNKIDPPSPPPTQTSSRIPLGLQAVFLASNRGKDVHKPPPEKAASKTFTRNWMFQGLRPGKTRRSKKKADPNLRKVTQFRSSTISETSHTDILDEELEPQAQYPSSAPTQIKSIIQQGPTATASPTKPKSGRPPMSPQAYLDVMIHARGYSTRRYRTLQTGYYSKPTEYQQASYHVNLVKHVRHHNVESFKAILESGISPNPCNCFGESLLHMVCRRGDDDLLQIMLDVGSSVQVSDDYGRTPLHDACWAATPSFATVEKIANRDLTLFHMTDSRGAVPLSYVRREHWGEWIDFLESKKDEWWPPIMGRDQPCELIDVAPNERPIPEPANAMSVQLAGMVASGAMTPEEARMLQEEDDDESMDDASSGMDESDSSDYDDSDDESDYDSDSDDDDDDSDSDDDDSDSEEDEFAELGMTMADMDDILKRVNYSSAQRVQ